MNKHVFRCLVETLHRRGGIDDSRHVSLEEQIGIFLYTCVTGASNRKVQERFQRSGDTISKSVVIFTACTLIFSPLHRYFHRVLNALVSPAVYNTYVCLPTINTPLAEEIEASPDFFPFFEDCLGAIDGTHILAYVPELDRPRYRDRKQQISQNVLAACSMDMRFLYVLPGWEGSASDGRVFSNARETDFHILQGKYYLADAGFPNCDALLIPYRAVRYHLKEWGSYGEQYVLLFHTIA
jgi:DDE superfamily endonuclease